LVYFLGNPKYYEWQLLISKLTGTEHSICSGSDSPGVATHGEGRWEMRELVRNSRNS